MFVVLHPHWRAAIALTHRNPQLSLFMSLVCGFDLFFCLAVVCLVWFWLCGGFVCVFLVCVFAFCFFFFHLFEVGLFVGFT